MSSLFGILIHGLTMVGFTIILSIVDQKNINNIKKYYIGLYNNFNIKEVSL